MSGEVANLLTIQKPGASRELVDPTSVSGVVLRFGCARVSVQEEANGDTDQTNVCSPPPVAVNSLLLAHIRKLFVQDNDESYKKF